MGIPCLKFLPDKRFPSRGKFKIERFPQTFPVLLALLRFRSKPLLASRDTFPHRTHPESSACRTYVEVRFPRTRIPPRLLNPRRHPGIIPPLPGSARFHAFPEAALPIPDILGTVRHARKTA